MSMNHKEIERWYRLKRIKTASQVLVIAAVVLAAPAYMLSKAMKTDTESFTAATAGSGMRIENFSYSAPGVHPWELKATSATVTDNLDNVHLVNPNALYKGGRGDDIRLTAETGKLDKASRRMTALGNVKVAYRDMALFASEIDYLDDKKTVNSSSEVRLDGGDLQVTGAGMRLSIDQEEVTIENDVKANISNVRLFKTHKKTAMGS